MEEMRLELELVKKQMRSLLIGQTKEGEVLSGGGGKSEGVATGTVVKSIARMVNQTQDPGEVEALKAELRKKSSELAKCQRDLENYQQEVRRLQRDIRKHVTSIDTLSADRQNLADTNRSLRHDLIRANEQCSAIKEANEVGVRTLTDANNNLRCELVNLKKKLKEIGLVPDLAGKVPFGAQKFPSKPDSISISELKEKVAALNDEIFQAAASPGESITHQQHEMTKEDASRMHQEVLQLIGEDLTTMIVKESQKPNAVANPLLVQVVLRVLLTNECASKVNLWVPNDAKVSTFFTAVYKNILCTEEPAVSGLWRAVTRANTRPVTLSWTEDIVSALMKIFKVAAWKTPNKEYRISFENKLQFIFKAIEDLRIAMGEKIISTDIQLSLVPSNSQFLHSWMEDALEDVNVVPGGPIQCVIGMTGFGLKEVITGQWGPGVGELLYQSVMSPKVVLASTLQDALKPIDSVMCGKI